MSDSLLASLFLNISLLLCASAFLTEFKSTRKVVQNRENDLGCQIIIGLLFGVMACLSTYFGVDVQGAIVNTRVVSVAGAGLIAGPVGGLIAGGIGGLHRYLYNQSSFTSLACGVGTVWFGVVGAVAQHYYSKTRHRKIYLVAVTIIGELFQVFWLLLLARPLSAVIELEKVILLPKILVNSVGMVLMFETFDRLRQNHTDELVQYQTRALYIADQCLPYLREGLHNHENLSVVSDIVRNNTTGYHVLLTDRTTVLAYSGAEILEGLLPSVMECLKTGAPQIDLHPKKVQAKQLPRCAAEGFITMPLRAGEAVIGTMTLLPDTGSPLAAESDVHFATTLAKFFSTILELNNVDYQIKLRHQAEFRAFQAQINPHFFYNTLNTISAFCRTKPDEARRLLCTLADYYRHTLSVNEEFVTLASELKNVQNYLIITRARFEDAIHLSCEWPPEAEEFRLPPLIIQPLVENAVRHGGTTVNDRRIHIRIWPENDRMWFSIRDEGHGFPPEVLKDLNDPENKRYSGLFNVSKRLLSEYGSESRLQVESTPNGSTVKFSLPIETERERGAPA